jgi:hypothetical protein
MNPMSAVVRSDIDAGEILDDDWLWRDLQRDIEAGRAAKLEGAIVLIQTRWHDDDLVGRLRGGQSESARVAAANALLDRGYGRPVQTIDSTVRTQPGELTGITDAELERIAKGSSGGASAQTNGKTKPDPIH